MTPSSSGSGRTDPSKHTPVSPERSESSSGSEFSGASASDIATSHLSSATHPPMTKSATGFSTYVTAESTSSPIHRGSSSESEEEILHLGVREANKTPYYISNGRVLSIRITTPNGVFLVPQTEEQWKQTADDMKGIQQNNPANLDLNKAFTVDFTHRSLIFTDEKGQSQALLYSRVPLLQSYISTMRTNLGENLGMTISEKEDLQAFKSLKKRNIKIINSPSTWELTKKSLRIAAEKVTGTVGGWFGKKPSESPESSKPPKFPSSPPVSPPTSETESDSDSDSE